MVGIVVVSHSAALADGVIELAREMGGPDVRLEAAGGLDLPGRPVGTDAALVAAAIERAYSEDGVLVLMDLGSAVLSAEMAVEMLPEDRRDRVVLCEAPLVEGAVSAAVTARFGSALEDVAAEARRALGPKAEHLSVAAEPGAGGTEAPATAAPGDAVEVVLLVENRLGLHARPAARFVQTASAFDARIEVTNVTTGRGPANARSLNGIATLGVRQGHEIRVRATGRQAREAVEALRGLRDRGFEEGGDAAAAKTGAAAGEAREAGPERAAGEPLAAGSELSGRAASPGIAAGPVRRFVPPTPDIPERGGDPRAEWEALERALDRVRDELRAARAAAADRVGEEEAEIFDAHLLFLEDEALLEPVRRSVFEEGKGAAHAWDAASREAVAAYREVDDEYLRARADDVLAVSARVVAHLLGAGDARPSLAGPGILVAADLAPADTATLDRTLVQGIALAFGGPTSHTAILARSLGIPAVVGLGSDLLSVGDGAPVVLDGERGVLLVEPPPDVLTDYRARHEARRERDRAARARARTPAVTRDGRRVEIGANVGSPDDVAPAVEAGADGVGLLRTEFLFLDRERLPDEEEQYRAYRVIAEALDGRPLVLRTLDVGGDKPLPALRRPREANPFLGVRGIRLALARPEVLAPQVRAALRVASEFPVKLMFPMVATLEEYRAARAVVERSARELLGAGLQVPSDLEVGIMVEVPAAALLADNFVPEVDFFSIGTNDLSQYTAAADRGNEAVAGLSDPLSPAVLRLVGKVVEAADRRGRRVGVCGEVAGDPLAIPLLVGLGVHELSMAPPIIPAAKEAVRSLDATEARGLAEAALRLDSAEAVRALVATAGDAGRDTDHEPRERAGAGPA